MTSRRRTPSGWVGLALGGLLSASGCERPASTAHVPEAPEGNRTTATGRVEPGETIPDVRLNGVGGDGTLHAGLHELVSESHADLVALVVSGGSWCGTCQWIAERGPAAFGSAQARVRRVDVILGDRDNAPADTRATAHFRDAYPALHEGVVLADPTDQLRPVTGPRSAMLPRVLLVNTSTLELVDVATNPSPAELEYRLLRALATGAGTSGPVSPPVEPRVDGLFLPHEWDLLSRTQVPSDPPVDRSNASGQAPAAAALGRRLFFDPALSRSGELSCASCHQPEQALSDGRARALGAGDGQRRTPSIALASHSRWQFWDGRADSLWAQALAPIEAEAELDGSRVAVARRMLSHYRDDYQAAFPEAVLPDPESWPWQGKPGVSSFDVLPADVQDAITGVFVDAGKAIAAWERTLRVEPNRLDAYLAGDFEALAPAERYGLHLFVRQGCMQCHWGPRLTDDAFHAVALSRPLSLGDPEDTARAGGLVSWTTAEFRRDGRWSDEQRTLGAGASLPTENLRHQFKTPALRGVANASHWGHAGQFDQLAGVTEAYGMAPLDPGSRREAWVPRFGETVQWGLVPFLKVLRAELRPDALPPLDGL